MNEHQLFVFCRIPNICLDGAQMLSKPLGVGHEDVRGAPGGGGATPPEGAIMWSGMLLAA